MRGLPMTEQTRRSSRDVWTAENARGLALAANASWPEAVDAFSRAADAVNAAQPPESPSHDALALVLGNLAQACFRAGRIDDGIRHAQRTCALRTALVGDDAISSARARADLAVMLGSVGRLDEASALMDRAIACMEQSAGDEDVRLIGPLENAARLALAAAQPANAEPRLLRLHALLAAHGYPTTRADVLLARVAAARVSLATVTVPTNAAPAASVTNGAQPIASREVTDDDQLIDALRVTDSLLRSTSRGTPSNGMPTVGPPSDAEVASPPAYVAPDNEILIDDASSVDLSSTTDDVRLDLVDEFLDSRASHATVSDAELDDDDDELDDAIVEIVDEELLDTTDEASLFESTGDDASAGLGFAIEHGPTQDRASSWTEITGFGPAEIGRDDIFAEPPRPRVEPDVEHTQDRPPFAAPAVTVSAAPASPVRPSAPTTPPTESLSGRPPEVRFYVTPAEGFVPGKFSTARPNPSLPDGIPVVMPTPRSSLFGATGTRTIRNVASRPTRAVHGSEPKGSRRVREVEDFPRITRKRSKEPTKGLALWQAWVIGAGVVAVACAVVVWYFRYRPV